MIEIILSEEKTVDSLSIIGILPDKVVIWIQFGTRYFIDYIYLIIGIPLLIDFLVVWSPKMGLRFGQSAGEGEQESEQTESSGKTTVNTVQLDEKFKFMYIYARNPNLFKSKDKVQQLDDEIQDIKSSYSPDVKGTSSDSKPSGSGKSGSKKTANKSKSKPSQKKHSQSYGLSDRLLKNGLNTLHLTFIAVVVLVNIAGYIHYSSIFDKYFTLNDRGYSINYAALDASTPEEREVVFNMQIKIEQINEVKYLPKSK